MNPNGIGQATRQGAIYRPKYRTSKHASGEFVLNGTAATLSSLLPSWVEQSEALEAWMSEGDKGKNLAARWHPDQANGLKIWCDPTLLETYALPLKQAILAWSAVYPEQLQIHMTIRPDEAQIRFEPAQDAIVGRPDTVGWCDRQVSAQGWITQAIIQVQLHPTIDQRLANESALFSRRLATCLHEVGHALGADHSDHPKDVMFHQGWRNTQLTVADSQQILSRYRQAKRLFTLL